MSQYNHYAKDLDTAFKEAREKYTAAYNTVEQARKAMQDVGTDVLRKQIATLQFQEAESSLRKEAVRIWAEFDTKAADLRRALEKEVQTSNLADPSAIDGNAVELLKTGVLDVDDYFSFADRYDKNPTMLKLIGHYAKEAADNADSTKDRVALICLAQDCARGMGTTLRAWDEMIGVANYCSGRGGNGQRRDSPGVTLSMGEWWEQLSGDFVENF